MNQTTSVTPYNGSIQPSVLPENTDDSMLIDMWLQTKRSPITRKNYALDIRDFMACTDKPLCEINLYDLQAYEQSLTGYAKASITRKLYCMKSLLSFAYETGYHEINAGRFIKPACINEELADRILTETEVLLMLALEQNKRNHALLRLLYHTGIRLAEVCNLQWSDCIASEDGGKLRIIGKRNKQRHVLVGAETWQELMSLPRTGTHVFMSSHKRPISHNMVGVIVAQAAIRANIDKNVSPHWLRHSAASHAIDRGCPITLVRDSLGHDNLTTTNRYSHAKQNHGLGEYLKI
jgi:integrase/recombinase XerD